MPSDGILARIDDLHDLEVLAVFSAISVDAVLTPEDIASMTNLPSSTAGDVAMRLERRGFLRAMDSPEIGYRYLVPESAAAEELARLIAEYRNDPSRVMAILNSHAVARARRAAFNVLWDNPTKSGK